MALHTGPQRLQTLFEDNWQASRTGRADIPDVITGDPKRNRGVVVFRDRESVDVDHAKHDLIHCYHPEANPPSIQDQGYKEQRIVETVQVDIDLTDRTDQTLPAGQQRLSAKKRMVGLRGDLANLDEPPYGGIAGEVKYILESNRRGLAEWDRVNYDYLNTYLGNSNATISLNVELVRLAANTVQ